MQAINFSSIFDTNLCVLGQVDVVDAGRVQVYGVESRRGAVDDLQAGPLFHRQVDQQRPVERKYVKLMSILF